MKTPIVAIIGLPNAGKSTLFNKVLERHKALTYPEAGTTRDRHYGVAEWSGVSFNLVDTAGVISRPGSTLEKNIQKQTQIALNEADMIILLADGRSPVSNEDINVGKQLRRSKKPVILAVNKIDAHNAKLLASAQAYKKLGLGEPIPISAVSGVGLGELLDEISTKLKKLFPKTKNDEDKDRLKLAFIGKPNVGKSSLINALLKQDRLLVDKKAGTTRSTVDVPFEFNGKKYLLLDTAGIKKKWKQDHDVDAAAAMQSLRNIPHADVIFLVLDASEELTFQDQAVAQQLVEKNKSVVVLMNKSDLVDKQTADKFLDVLPRYLPHLWWTPVVLTSAATGVNLSKILELAWESFTQYRREISLEQTDSFLDKILKEHPPGKMADQRQPKLYSFKQVAVCPPTFRITLNIPAALNSSWKKYMEKQFRLKFGFIGTPVIFFYERRK